MMFRVGVITKIFGALLVCFGFDAATITAADEMAERIDRARASVVQLLVSGAAPDGTPKRSEESGSGFVVHSDNVLRQTFLLTAGHVIGKREEWLFLDGDKLSRKITVLNQDKEVLEENAIVIAEWRDLDAALLAIRERPILPLSVATSAHLKQSALVGIAGFPASVSDGQRFSSDVLRIKRADLPNLKLEIRGAAKPGQSGGPVIDELGNVVAIVGENDDKRRPETHRATIVSGAIELLNAYLRERGRPQLPIRDASLSTGKISGIVRSGRALVHLNGSQGDLAKGLAAEHILGSAQETRIQAKGDEKSECDEALGRTLSNARAAVAISSFESTGLKFKLDLFAQGGHYYTATACIGPPTLTSVPVGLINMDTAAVARVEFAGELILEVPTSLPLDLRVVWQEMPTDAELDIIDPFNGVRSFDVEGNGERVVEVAAAGIWRLRVAARVEASASNAAISKEHHGKSLFFIEAR